MLILEILLIAGCGLSLKKSDLHIPSEVIEQIINDKDLQGFLHPEIEGRVPLIISDNLIGPDTPIYKFGEKVKILPESEIKTEAFIKFEEFSIFGDTATIKMIYEIEGIVAEFVFKLSSEKKWNLAGSEIWERSKNRTSL